MKRSCIHRHWLRQASIALLLLATCLGMPLAAEQTSTSQSTEPEITEYQRFVSYPHLEKGLQAFGQKNYALATEELEQAYRLAPNSQRITVSYAIALEAAGNRSAALAVLKPWISNNTAKPEMRAAYREMALSLNKRQLEALGNASNAPDFKQQLAQVDTRFDNPYDESVYVKALAASPWVSDRELQAYTPVFSENGSSLILQRLTTMRSTNSGRMQLSPGALVCKPLPSGPERSMQIEMLKDLKACDCLRTNFMTYANNANALDARDWANISQCYSNTPGLAEYSANRSINNKPTPSNLKQLAYSAYLADDYATALIAWKKVPPDTMTPADRLAAQTTAIAAGDMGYARAQFAAYNAKGTPPIDRYDWNRALVAINDEAWPDAADYLQAAIKIKPEASYYEKLALVEDKLGHPDLALLALEKAAELSPNDSQIQSGLGFMAYQQEDYPLANKSFTEARKGRPDDVAVTEQLAYTYQKQGTNDQAIRYSKLAIDDYQRRAPVELSDRDINTEFGLRRMNEDLSRRWTFNVDGAMSNNETPLTGSPQPGLSYRNYWQAEAAYRLGEMGVDNGKTYSAYSRIFSGNGFNSNVLPLNAPMLGMGLRWKPFSEHVINLAAEEQFPLDNVQGARTDTLVRASGSFFNSGRYSDDWHPTGSGWLAQNLYLDAAYYLGASTSTLTADYRTSYHFKLANAKTLEPYAHLQWNTMNTVNGDDVRVGVGVRWNLWRNEDKYNAYSSRYFLGIEGQRAFTTYLNSKNAILAILGVRL